MTSLIIYGRMVLAPHLTRFRRDEEGAVATEYGFLIVFIAIAVAFGAVFLGQALLDLFSDTGDTVGSSNLPANMPVVPTAPS